MWTQTVNERTEHMRHAISDYPWTEQAQHLQQHSESDNDTEENDDVETDTSPERRETPPTEPIFVTNPPGPVDCAEVRCVALTFDDGPVPNTQMVLAALSDVDARATFYMTGGMTAAHPSIAAEVTAAGHDVGSHGYSHTDFTDLGQIHLVEELSNTAAAMESATGMQPETVRPPYGTLSPQVLESLDLPVIMWSVDSKDWQHKSADQTHEKILDGAEPGAIVLMHDLEDSTTEALPLILRDLLAKGYHLVTVSEILGHAGESGQVYYSGLSP